MTSPGRPSSRRVRGHSGATRDREWRIERGVAIRAGFYIFDTHLFAGFVWLLYYPGEHAHKRPGNRRLSCPGDARRVIGA
ncbi:DUF6126 family protein [Streptomyces sp. NPDC050549]|uniref:DUF6126 family protein n=1 Tax=Streptomyces sp. NPDC050549 TaxID=3155406 RepID=UPI0034148FC6